MASGKPPAAPKAPKNAPTPTVSTGFGSTSYDKKTGQYGFSSQYDPQYAQSEQSAQLGFQNQLNQVNNPHQSIAQQQQVYRNLMEPAFDMESHNQMGQLKAGLGNRYFSTFGQLMGQQGAMQQGLGRAQLEKDIFDSGQSYYDKLLSRAGTFGGLVQQAQENRYRPYLTLAQLMGQGTAATGMSNQSQNQQFSTQAQNYNTSANYISPFDRKYMAQIGGTNERAAQIAAAGG